MEVQSEIRKNSDPAPQFPHKSDKKVSFSDDLPERDDRENPKSSENHVAKFEMSPFDYAFQRSADYMAQMHESKEDLASFGNESPQALEISSVFPNERKWSIHKDTSPGSFRPSLKPNVPNSSSVENVPVLSEEMKSCSDEKSLKNLNELIIQSAKSAAETLTLNEINSEPVPCSIMELEVRRDKLRWLLISECSAIFGEEKHSLDGFQKIFLSQNFMQNLFHLFDIENKGHLTQDKWIEHIKGRLCEDKQIEFAEQLESVAYVLCGEDSVNLTKFRQIWEAKRVLDRLYRMIDVDATNQISTNQIMEFISNLTNSRPKSGFDKTSLERLEQLFRKTVGNEKEIKQEDFKKILTSKNPFFTDRVFTIFDKDNSGSISLQEFIDAIHQFAGQSPEDKIKFLFKVYDLDGDGLIQHLELQHVMRACMEENGMRFSEDQIEDLTMAMFEDADPNNRGAITYEALKNQLEKHGGLLENLSISIDRWLVPLPQEERSKGVTKNKPNFWMQKLPYQLTAPYIKNNYVYISYIILFVLINAVLFVSRAIQYRNSNVFVIFARACGQCLNFNCAWVLVLMLRQTLTFLRTRGCTSFLPIDQHIYLHKITGVLIAIYSLVHTIMHLVNFTAIVVNDPVLNEKNYSVAIWLFTTIPGHFGLIPGCANPSGVVLFFILLIMFVCSQPFVRRGGSFEIFYWTHLLYVPFWIFLIFHGPNFWKWFIVPGLIYILERVTRIVWMKSKHGKTYISSGLLLPSKVTHLVIKRPLHFHFRPGDYVFVNIPAIAKYEWHPFTLSSAPEQEEYIWIHIRGVGEWTNRLHEFFEREQERLHNGEIEPVIATSSKSSVEVIQEKRPLMHVPKAPSLDSPLAEPGLIKKAPPGTSKLALKNYPAQPSKVERQQSENKAIAKIRAQIQRTLSRRDTSKNIGHANEGFVGDDGRGEKKLLDKIFQHKAPLEKSLSMPDMQNKVKKRERMMVLREYMRSESERSFDEVQMRKARMQSLGLAYLSPQNKSLAQSFRYMRNKPIIIAFKTPSLENCEPRDSTNSMIVYPGAYSQKEAEEGKLKKPNGEERKKPPAVNYPVGKPLEIHIDGPYGAPSSHIFRAQHAILIATGIGVTPFASILQSIMHRYWKARHACPNCNYNWSSEIPPTIMNLRKVDFFWINRDQRSFEWFVNLLSQLEIEQAELGGAMERFLDMHMYITSALQKTDMKAVGLQLALDLLHQKEKRDLITGLKTRTNAGRPNWDKVFKQITDQKKGKVTVFYCGPPQLAKTLRYKCDQYGFAFRKEVF